MTPRALILDDSRVMRNILAKILLQRGFEPLHASNGIEALKLMELEGSSISVILADWNMPEMDGLEFVKALRAHSEFAQIPVMMVTSETDSRMMAEALSAGANEYIMKPFTPEIVADKLQLLQFDGAGSGSNLDHPGAPWKPLN